MEQRELGKSGLKRIEETLRGETVAGERYPALAMKGVNR